MGTIDKLIEQWCLDRAGKSVKCSLEVKPVDTVSIPAHFDGEHILLDEPFELEPNTKLIVTVVAKQQVERESWLRLSAKKLAGAYAQDEEEYSLDSIKEANAEYEGR